VPKIQSWTKAEIIPVEPDRIMPVRELFNQESSPGWPLKIVMKNLFLSTVLAFVSSCVWGQFTITGTVMDEDSAPLTGAVISLNDAYTYAISNREGKFSIAVNSGESATIKVDFLGYKTSERLIAKSTCSDLEFLLLQDAFSIAEVQVASVQLNKKTPMAFTEMNEDDLERLNFGQDLPYLLRMQPSVVTTSDAGAGIGYTGLRIRGSDATRINVTINGIPVNDSEGQGVFWVNLPDFGSSVNSVQIQRGVGTSSNGAAAFGGTVNLQTTRPDKSSYFKTSLGGGSYNTLRSNLEFSTGMIDNKWNFNGRLSKITSDGYIDRASANLSSLYLNAGLYLANTTIQAVAIKGQEKTYQSWYGTPEAVLENDQAGLENLADNVLGLDAEDRERLLNADRTYNFYEYDNQVDDYKQDHYQLHLTQIFSSALSLNVSGHYTSGAGFFEEYKKGEDLTDYGITVEDDQVPIGQVSSSDIIRRRWLDNDFYGAVWALNYRKNRVNAVFGGAINQYKGDHFGEVLWAQYAGNSDIRERYYESDATKNDYSSYLKANYDVNDNFNVFADVQGRFITYELEGTDNDLRNIQADTSWSFINPKIGASYAKGKNRFYGSFSVANREPTRGDIIDAVPGTSPKHETLNDLEIGYSYTASKFAFNANIYNMMYTNQLVLTGEVNDVGSAIRTNVDESYRRGIELIAGVNITKKLNWQVNMTVSENKIESFTESVSEIIFTEFEDTDISFSPNLIAGSDLGFKILEKENSALNVNILTKYVSDQYLNNTSNEDKKIDAYLVNDVAVRYSLKNTFVKELGLSLLVNNFLSEDYSSNGYTYSYAYQYPGANDEMITVKEEQNAYYPQAPINFLFQLDVKF
jgi:iron complex outermembrane receptor protein